MTASRCAGPCQHSHCSLDPPWQRNASTAVGLRKVRKTAPSRRRATGPAPRRACRPAQSPLSAHSMHTQVPAARDLTRAVSLVTDRMQGHEGLTSEGAGSGGTRTRVGFGSVTEQGW